MVQKVWFAVSKSGQYSGKSCHKRPNFTMLSLCYQRLLDLETCLRVSWGLIFCPIEYLSAHLKNPVDISEHAYLRLQSTEWAEMCHKVVHLNVSCKGLLTTAWVQSVEHFKLSIVRLPPKRHQLILQITCTSTSQDIKQVRISLHKKDTPHCTK